MGLRVQKSSPDEGLDIADGGSPETLVRECVGVVLGASGGGERGRESRPMERPGDGVPVNAIFSLSERKRATSASRVWRRCCICWFCFSSWTMWFVAV